MEKIYPRRKLIVGENGFSGKDFRHLTKISSLFPDEVFPEKVLRLNTHNFHKKLPSQKPMLRQL